jgi:hypothetical protein
MELQGAHFWLEAWQNRTLGMPQRAGADFIGKREALKVGYFLGCAVKF